MNRLVIFGSLAFSTIAFAGCAGSAGSPSAPLPPTSTQPLASAARSTDALGARFIHVCAAPVAGEASCHSLIDTETGIGRSPQGRIGPTATASPAGYGPVQLQTAYNIISTGTSITGPTVAIVDAYDNPNLESDLQVYRSTYGLPPCTSASGCFTKVNQTGGTALPKSNASWGQETSLDVDMVSANCPTCKILVVEANSATFANLSAGVTTAAGLGVVAISNSYGGSESSGESTYAPNYNHPGIAITASSGDSGYGAQSPASFGTVIATGGTTLKLTSSNTRSSETVWSGAGSGCSAYEKQPSWQTGTAAAAICKMRMIADVAYDADPNTGVAVYDTLAYRGQSGWLVFGGTSVASPAIASIYARGGNLSGYPANYTYTYYAKNSTATGLFDITSGSNGSCGGTYYCTGEVGYDGPTGLGSPIGLSAF